MKKKFPVFAILVFAYFLFPTETYSAWTQPKGHAYNQLTYAYYHSDHRFSTLEKNKDSVEDGFVTGNGDDVKRYKSADFIAHSITYYGEYGIIDKLTVFTAIPWKKTRSEDTMKEEFADHDGPYGIGDIGLGLRYKLFDNLFGTGVLMSAQGEVKIPEAYDYENPLTHLSLGDGQYDTTLAILFGKAIGGKGYAVLNVGYKYRFENNEFNSFKPSDQIKVFLTGGYTILPKLSLRGSIDWAKSIGNASVSNAILHEYGDLGNDIDRFGDHVLIKDALNLEPDVLNLGVSLAYSFDIKARHFQAVASYNIDVEGIEGFGTKDSGQGEQFSVALVYIF